MSSGWLGSRLPVLITTHCWWLLNRSLPASMDSAQSPPNRTAPRATTATLPPSMTVGATAVHTEPWHVPLQWSLSLLLTIACVLINTCVLCSMQPRCLYWNDHHLHCPCCQRGCLLQQLMWRLQLTSPLGVWRRQCRLSLLGSCLLWTDLYRVLGPGGQRE
jgi:hypothetical protein